MFRAPRTLCKIAILVLGFLAGVCHAEESDPSASGLWLLAKYDVDGDKQISVMEIGEKREKMFNHMDKDEDGEVSFNEYQTLDSRRRELVLKARFNKLDINQDGTVDAEEYRSYVGSFDRFDRNGDGKITSGEMKKTKVAGLKQKEAGDGSSQRCLLWVCVRSSF